MIYIITILLVVFVQVIAIDIVYSTLEKYFTYSFAFDITMVIAVVIISIDVLVIGALLCSTIDIIDSIKITIESGSENENEQENK